MRPTTPPADQITIGLDSAPLTLDPRFSTDATASQIEELIFDGLTRVDDHQQRIPHLATHWETPDDRTYVFHLRDDVRFSDGTRLDADDVKATYESVLEAQGTSPKRGPLVVLERIEALDASTLRFHLREPFAPFLSATSLGILPQESIHSPASQPLARPLGSGPFRLRATNERDSIELERNPFHPAPPKGLQRLLFRVIPDATTRILELQHGGIDLVQSGLEPDMLAWIERQPGIRVNRRESTSFQYLGFNVRDPRLADRRVRRAIALAIDREAIVHNLLEDTARVASGMLSPTHWAFTSAGSRLSYNPRRARRLLDLAGWRDPDGDGPVPRFRLELDTTSVELRRRIAEVLQADLAAVGIELAIRTSEWASFYATVRRGNFQIYSLAWVGIEDPDLYFLSLHSSQLPPRGMNRGFYQDSRMDRLTENGRKELDRERRRRLYASVQIRASRELPVIPLWWPQQIAVLQRRLQGFETHANGSYRSLADAWIEDGSKPARN